LTLSALVAFVFPAIVIFAALRDTTTLTIPNWLTGLGLVAFIPAALIAHIGLADLGLCLATGVGCLLIGMGVFAAGWAGGGDAKLLAVCGLWLGWRPVGPFLMWTVLAGGAFSLFLIILRRFFGPLAARAPTWAFKILNPKGEVPYGVAIAAGALMAFPHSAIMLALQKAGL
jgi:prepilin peptidase CpaA